MKRSRVSGITPRAFGWDFDGCCAPASAAASPGTFSVGIFQWVPTKDWSGLKRGKVVQRISGPSHDPESVYAKAREAVARREGVTAGEEATS